MKKYWFLTVMFIAVTGSLSAQDLVIPRYGGMNSAAVIGILASGLLLGLLCYNLFLFLSTREKQFGYFTIMMVLLSILQLFSTYERFLFELTYNRVTILTHLLFITFLLFFEDFYAIGDHHKRLSRINRISIIVIIAYTFLFLFGKAVLPEAVGLHAVLNFIRELFVFYTNILFLSNCIIAMRWMKTEALIILIAFIPPAVLTSINALNIFAFMSDYQGFVTFMMQYNQPVGLSLQAILLSLALGYRYNRLKAERLKVEQLDREKTEFFLSVSHELKTPLTIILGLSTQLKDGFYGARTSLVKPVYESIEKQSLVLLRRIESMLRLGKTQHADTYENISIDRQLRLYVSQFASIASDKQVELVCSIDPKLKHSLVLLPLEDFESLIMNLLSNAVKYSREDDLITVSAERVSSGIRVMVRDTGPGIPEGLQKKVFEQYTRLGQNAASGTGLGLSVVKRVADEYDISLSLKTNSDGGCTFTLLFPQQMIREEQQYTGERRHNTSGYTAEFRKPALPEIEKTGDHETAILVVEDNEEMRGYITSILSGTYEVVCAEDGKQALKLLEKQRFDMVITDIRMPVMDGEQLFEACDDRRIPFIFLTAYGTPEKEIESLERGVVAFISKPFTPKQLLVTVTSVLSREKQIIDDKLVEIRKNIQEVFEKASEHAKHLHSSAFERAIQLEGAEDLSVGEKNILGFLVQGLSDKEIAAMLHISVRTVSNHNRSIYRKLSVSGRNELFSKL
jgi:signal transduction histidine kinase/DNA-binding NarL/FixJ family response regulator